ncbi:DUF3782 domain-containing protein [Cronbergia sp. UHCC 0137]|uniref:DUF3782 domain-containing protein n=1 Tax=Cronbergia sp. UHCC 0137 TaxID=3110239 RepID=UPI002B21FE0A|nr:DUF3782 domain-containing protein [Cronbergia sp. UHCC 0137]MEA5617905.1 DUF3782 domain-containing protein [Cronbergia sp. UHCC 0137]
MSEITLEDIYALFRESEQQRKQQQQAFEERQRVYEQEMADLRLEREQQQQAFQKAFEERQQAFEERQRVYEQEMADLRKIVAQTNKQVGGITSRWGEFVENLVRPATARLFQEQGINVHHTALRVDAQDTQGSLEIDILAENTNEVVAIEVKSHLEVRDVKRFLQILERFKMAFPKYQSYQLYGAVAGIKIDERADIYAVQEGLFVIKPAGDSVIIANNSKFEPKVW